MPESIPHQEFEPQRQEGEEAGNLPNLMMPADALTQDQVAQFQALEESSERSYSLRTQLKHITAEITPYLPQITVVENGQQITRLANWADLKALDEQGILEVEIRAKIEEVIPPDNAKRNAIVKGRVRNILSFIQKGLNSHNLLNNIHNIERTEEEQKDRSFIVFRLKERMKAKRLIEYIEDQIEEIQVQINDTRDQGWQEFLLEYNNELNELKAKRLEIINSTPEAYLYFWGRFALKVKRTFSESGTIVETSYVRTKIHEILEKLETGPVFIYGELGSGKTELANHLCRTRLSLPHIKRWEEQNPMPQNATEEQIKDWQNRRDLQREPLEVRGVRTLEKEEITTKVSLTREQRPEPEKMMELLEQESEKYRQKLIAKAEKEIENEDERKSYIDEKMRIFEKLFLEKYSSNIITREQLSPVFQAMAEGRPVVVNEVNAIPHHVWIVLNDIITKKPGDTIYTPEGNLITVKEGFYILSTGNWDPEQNSIYVGRQPVDAASLSRWGLVQYDYLPQDTSSAIMPHEDDSLSEGEKREHINEDELFFMLAMRLLNDDLTYHGPVSAFERIYSLARVARVLQDVFSKRDLSQGFYFNQNGSMQDPRNILKENVLSLRHLIPIVESWKKDGYIRSLDDYIFIKYVSRSSARPEEKLYIYQLLQMHGDFFKGSDWPQAVGGDAQTFDQIKNLDIARKMYHQEGNHSERIEGDPEYNPETSFLSPMDTIEKLFGPAPKRQEFPNLELLAQESGISEIEKARDLLHILEETDRLAEGLTDEEDRRVAQASGDALRKGIDRFLKGNK